MDKVVVIGVGMTKFGKHEKQDFKELTRLASEAALSHAGITSKSVEAVFVANAMAGAVWGQESVRGQVFLSGSEFSGCLRERF
jgi:acetyl-CoA acyltransferase